MDKSKYLVFIGLASEIIFLELGLIYAGRWADQKWSIDPYGVLVGALLALVIWFVHIIQALKVIDKEADSNESTKSE